MLSALEGWRREQIATSRAQVGMSKRKKLARVGTTVGIDLVLIGTSRVEIEMNRNKIGSI